MYRFILDRDHHTDFIFNKEDVYIEVDYDSFDDPVKKIQSKENLCYYEFLRNQASFRKKFSLLTPLLGIYPKDDKFYKEIVIKVEQTQKDYLDYIEGVMKKQSQLFASKMIAVNDFVPFDVSLSEMDRKKFIRAHFFDKVPMRDTSLLRTNVYANKVIEYLSFYSNQELPQKLLEKEFIKAVDVILATIPMEPTVYDFVLSYLVGGFEKFKFEEVLNHIYENYLVKLGCENDKVKSDLASRIDGYQKMAIGKTAPEFSVPDLSGKPVTIATSTKDYILLVFWASWCPHCQQMIPALEKIYDGTSDRKFEVVTISLDTAAAPWKDYLSKQKTTWYNCSELKGWESKVAKDYHIYATPTMFLLDRQRKIIAKPITISDLQEDLVEKGLIQTR